jgi:hypothetical protein
MITKQQLIANGILENSISIHTCNKCRGILIGQKPNKLVCVDCATTYKAVNNG